MLLWLCGLHTYTKRTPPNYSWTIENEIRRISRLKEPFKTNRAIDLLTRFVDAESVAKSFFEFRLPAEAEKIENKLENLIVEGKARSKRRIDPTSEAVDPLTQHSGTRRSRT
jgi:hypothetical protein